MRELEPISSRKTEVNWQTFTVSDWNHHFEQHFEKLDKELEKKLESADRLTLKEILGKESVPETIVDWLRIILVLEQNQNNLFEPQQKSKRLKIFTLPNQVTLPSEMLGHHAILFVLGVKQKYQGDDWKLPFSLETIKSIYEAFDKLDSDLIEDPEWHKYWMDKKIALEKNYDPSTNSGINFDEYFESIQDDILAGYRQFVISKSYFLDFEEDEEMSEHSLRELRAHEYFYNISKYKVIQTPEKTHQVMLEHYSNKMTQEVMRTTMFIKSKLTSGTALNKAIAILQNEINDIVSSSAYEYLPLENSHEILAPLQSLLYDYKEITRLIDENINCIASQFVPSFDQDSHVRVLSLIIQASDAIKNSDAFNRRYEVGSAALKQHFTSAEAVTRSYQLALKARVEYYANLLPNDLDILVGDSLKGLKWIRYPRARREVISVLYNMVMEDENKFPPQKKSKKTLGVKITPEQREALIKLQSSYFTACEEDIHMSSKEEALNLMKSINVDKIFEPIPKSKLNESKYTKGLVYRKILLDMAESKDSSDVNYLIPELYSRATSPEYDVTFGLYKELSGILTREDEEQEDLPDNYTVDQIKEEPYEELLYNKFNHERLGERLSAMSNPEDCLLLLEHLFEHISHPDNLHRTASGFGKIFQYKYNDTQKSAIELLQEIYIKALKRVWIFKAKTYDNVEFEGGKPISLDICQKNQIYMEYLRAARRSKLMNCETSSGRVAQLHYQIHRIVLELNAIPDSDLQ